MKVAKKTYDFTIKSCGTGVLAIVIFFILILGIILFIGCISYWFLSIIFPEYIAFGWDWIRFLALGLLMALW